MIDLHRFTLPAFLLSCALGTSAAAQDAFVCGPVPEPVFSLALESRYTDKSVDRDDLDKEASARVDEELDPIDSFLSDLANMANKVFEDGADKRAVADCVISQIAVWAEANALADLQSRTSKFTIGSRLSALGMILSQVKRHGGSGRELGVIEGWLEGLIDRQMVFWEEDATDGAKQGNLRAWAALAAASASDFLDDPVMRGWSAWSVHYILCKADPDGSLPQEMRRGKFAYHYQLHAIAPLVTTAALLKPHGYDLDLTCDRALQRAAKFTIDDLDDGEMTRKIAGEVQTYFDGTRTISGFNLAWIEAYLTLDYDLKMDAVAEEYRPLSHSKLGGDQTKFWAGR